MAKLTLTDLTSGYNLVAPYNANNGLVETAIENTLSRDGTAPNDMQANLDMGDFRIINLGAPVGPNDAVRVVDIESGTVTVVPNADWDDITNIPSTVDDIATLSDPGSDKLVFWDDSAGALVYLTVSTGLSITGTSITASGSGSSDWDDLINIPPYVESLGLLSDPNADRIVFWDDSASNLGHLTAGTGLNITGTTLSFSFLGLQALTDPNNDRIVFWDDSGGALQWLTVGSGLSITGTTLAADSSAAYVTSLGLLSDPNADRILFWDDSASNIQHLAPGTYLSITGTTIDFVSTTGSYTGTLTGVTTTVTGSVKYSINGNKVTLEVPLLEGTANSTAHTITGATPVAMRPATDQFVLGLTKNNTVAAFGMWKIGTDGTITLYNVLSAVFAGTGTEGAGNFTVSYHKS